MSPVLSEVGERWMVGRIQRLLSEPGIGDDCAFIGWGKDYLLATSDAVSISTHLPWPGPRAWGWYCAAANLSDIAAKGGEPLGLLLSYLLPRSTDTRTVLDITRGARDCCARFGTRVLGGDTKEAPEVCLAGTALGRVPKKEFLPRSGARPGDILAVTGRIGGAAAGFLALKEGRRASAGKLRPLLRPTPRLREGRAAARTRSVSACTDLSDGLSASVHQLCIASGAGAEVLMEALPVSPALLEREAGWEPFALHFGGDYELMMSVRPKRWPRVKCAVERTGTELAAIGKVVPGRRVVLVERGGRRPLKYGGWEHFRGRR